MTQDPESPKPPPALALAWGVRGGGRRGPKPARSLGEIVSAAVRIADAEGIEALSMQRLAADLGFSTMALYRYVASKEDLVLLTVDAAAAGAPDVPAPGEDWRAGLERWARQQLAVLRRHSWVARVPISGPPLGPNQVAWMEGALRCLAETSLDTQERVAVLTLLAGFVRNHHQLYDEMARASAAAGMSLEESERAYAEMLLRLIDRERFPQVAATFREAADAAPREGDPDAEFEFGLGRILDGIGTLIERRRTLQALPDATGRRA